MKKTIYTLVLLGSSLFPFGVTHAFWSYLIYQDHQDITKAALSAPNTFCFAQQGCYSFSATAIDQINEMHQIVDNPDDYVALGGPINHFDSDSMVQSLQEIASRRDDLNTLFSFTPNAATQLREWQLMGYMLHAIEDFYAHSSWVDLGNIAGIVDAGGGFGALTESPSNPIIPPSFTASLQGSFCPPATGFPLLQPVGGLVTGFYPPATGPVGSCIHGDLILIANSCVASVKTIGAGLVVPGISHDIPCAYNLLPGLTPAIPANSLHTYAKQLATQDVNSFAQAIVADLAATNNVTAYCQLLGLDSSLPICQQYSIGVSVTGLLSGAKVVLTNNGGDNLTVSGSNTPTASGTFSTLLASGASYSVGVVTSLSEPGCTVTNGSGKVANANVVVTVSCANDYSVGVTVTGLTQGAALTVQDNVGDQLTVTNSVPVTFKTPFPNTSVYKVSIVTPPTGETCIPGSNASGTINGASVNVTIVCQSATGISVTPMVSAGDSFACALSHTGSVYCWGTNAYGQLGESSIVVGKSNTPVQMNGITGGATSVTAGGYHACAVTGGGGAVCWGWNLYGELGNGSTNSGETPAPTPVVGLSGVAAISAGLYHTCAVTTAGGAVCWGSNSAGQLGDGSTTDSSVPVAVSGLSSGVVSIAASWYYTCAVTTDGSVWCWGSNTNNNFGNGTGVSSSVPVRVLNAAGSGPLSGITAIATGAYSACALSKTGAAWCWGDNSYGELGNGLAASSYPTTVSGLSSGVSSIGVGDYFACASTSAGAAFCWGVGGAELGDNNGGGNQNVPKPVTGSSTGVVGIWAGYGFACSLTTLGTVWCWGGDGYGELGDGIFNNVTGSAVPVQVVGVGGGGSLQL